MTLSESKSTATWGLVLGNIIDVLGAEIHASATAQTGSIIGSSAIASLAVEKSVLKDFDQGDAATLKYNATSVEGAISYRSCSTAPAQPNTVRIFRLEATSGCAQPEPKQKTARV